MTSEETLFARAAAALEAVGRDPELNERSETIRFVADGRTTLGVIMNSFDSVIFYSVWPEQVPEEALVRVSEFVLRANTELYTSALELDLDKRILSARSGVDCAPLGDLDNATLGGLLGAAIDEANRVATTHHEALARIVEGGDAFEALALRAG